MAESVITVGLGLIDAVLTSTHALDVTSGRATHEPALKLVAQISPHTQDCDAVSDIVKSLLPECYAGDTLGQVPKMLADAIKKGFHEQKKNPEKSIKETQAIVAFNLFMEEKPSLFHTSTGEVYAKISGPDGGQICRKIGSTEIRNLIGHRFYQRHGKLLPNLSLSEVIHTLKAKAMYDGDEQEVHVRLAHGDEATYIDLGRRDCKCVKIDKAAVTVIDEPPINFIRPKGFGELPLPEAGGSLSDLQEVLGLDSPAFMLTVAFIISFFCPIGPRFGMIVQGEQGSGKSVLTSTLKGLLDPSIVDRTRMPRSEHELAIMAEQNAVLVFDNASGLPWELSDFLCTLLTGGSLLVRKLYTEDEFHVFTFKQSLLMNGIGDYASRPDLLERCIQVNLKTMPEYSRKTERELEKLLEEITPSLLCQIYECVSCAYKNLDDVDAPRNIRMSDAAQWIIAAEPATDFDDGSFSNVLVGVQRDMMAERIINNPLVIALIAHLEKNKNSYEGTVGRLFDEIKGADPYNRSLPRTAAHLSNNIKRLGPAMAKIGLKAEFGERTRTGKLIKVWLEEGLAGNEADRDF